jgi:hypothetical protein
MGILLGLTPFVAFFVAMRLASPLIGLLAALANSALLCAWMYRRGKSVKILEIGSLLLFGTLVLYTLIAAPEWTVATVRLAVDAGLLTIVVVSLAIGRPFTLQYAREQVPKELWATPSFVSANRLITLVWAAAFAVLVATDGAAEYLPSVPVWIDVAGSIAAFGGAVGFTIWYPAMLRRRAQAAGSGNSS